MPQRKGPPTDLKVLPMNPRQKPKKVPKPQLPKGLGRKQVAKRPFGNL